MRDYTLYLKDILEAMSDIELFVEGMSFEIFHNDNKTTSAVVRKFEIMGEATKQIPDEIKHKYSDVPWKEMAGMRDRLIHFYFGVDYDLVWSTIKNRLPQVKLIIKKIIDDASKT
ncbi:MAG: DUF86 domain-containing protein [Thermodesulfovibrionales bacterium]